MRKTIQFKEFDDIKLFNEVASRQEYDIDLERGRFIIDGKSLLGVYSLDLSKPIDVILHTDEDGAKDFIDAMGYLFI